MWPSLAPTSPITNRFSVSFRGDSPREIFSGHEHVTVTHINTCFFTNPPDVIALKVQVLVLFSQVDDCLRFVWGSSRMDYEPSRGCLKREESIYEDIQQMLAYFVAASDITDICWVSTDEKVSLWGCEGVYLNLNVSTHYMESAKMLTHWNILGQIEPHFELRTLPKNQCASAADGPLKTGGKWFGFILHKTSGRTTEFTWSKFQPVSKVRNSHQLVLLP